MRLFLKYLRQFRRPLLFFIICGILSAGIFVIYGVPLEPLIYVMACCALVGMLTLIFSFAKFRRKHHMLREIYINLPLLDKKISDPENLIEDELGGIITRLHDINQENITLLKDVRRDNSDYFTVWVHQIKTPIAAMQMILQEDDSDISRELSAELFRIEQYAEMALQFIRLDSDTTDYVIRHHDIDLIIKQAVRRYAPLFIRRKIKLEYKPVHKEILTDKKWLVFVIEQLLSNAVKYTKKGSVTVKFENDILSVCDTGIGIAAEDLPRIFEKGYTGMSGRTDKKSTGLGLYLCKKVCDRLGHRISAVSGLGLGSVFSVDLTHLELDIE